MSTYRENGHIFDGDDFLECSECGAIISADDTLGKLERCSSAPYRFYADGCLIIDGDYESLIGVATSDCEAIRWAEDESVRRLMVGDHGIIDDSEGMEA